MAFAPPFQRPFSAPFDRRAAAAAVPWWLAGDVAAANAVAVYQPKGAASLAASYTNLANPGTYDAAPGVAPTWAAATGWTGNGINTYLTTGLVPASDWSMIGRFSGASNYGIIAGSWTTSATYFGLQPAMSDNKHYYLSGFYVGVAPSLTNGVMAVAARRCFLNGSFETTTNAWTGTATRAITLLAFNAASIGLYFVGDVQAIAIYNTTLSDAQVALISAAMAAL